MTLRIIGDVHGKMFKYQRLLERANQEQIPTFQVGDMGLGFKGVNLKPKQGLHQFIRGNHDDPAACRAHPMYAGDYGFDSDRDLFFLGGAYSIDWEWRRQWNRENEGQGPGSVVWWPDEELSQEELDKARDLYLSFKPRVMITHDCPASVAYQMLNGLIIKPTGGYYEAKKECAASRTCVMLEQMFSGWQPQQWVFGHYHMNWHQEIRGTKFTCVAELATFDVD